MTLKSIATLLAVLAITVTSPGRAAEKDVFNYKAQHDAPAGTKRIVFIAATETHGKPGAHEFMAGGIYFARTINADYPNAFAVVYPVRSRGPWPTDPPIDVSKADAIIVLLNHSRLAATDPRIKAAVERGAGFMAIHFGVEVEAGEQGRNFLDWIGGYFEAFWSVNPTWTADIIVGKHPTTRGVHPFSITDEWYYHMRFRDGMKGVTPILSAIPPASTMERFHGTPTSHGGNADALADVMAHKPQILAWAYDRPNGGRGFGFTGFHRFSNLTNDSFRTTLLNGIAWVSGLEIPPDGVASTTPTQEQLDELMTEAHKFRGAGRGPRSEERAH